MKTKNAWRPALRRVNDEQAECAEERRKRKGRIWRRDGRTKETRADERQAVVVRVSACVAMAGASPATGSDAPSCALETRRPGGAGRWPVGASQRTEEHPERARRNRH
ncbi:hypothetical protein ACJQWK_11169 [Exserohilum turcicum]